MDNENKNIEETNDIPAEQNEAPEVTEEVTPEAPEVTEEPASEEDGTVMAATAGGEVSEGAEADAPAEEESTEPPALVPAKKSRKKLFLFIGIAAAALILLFIILFSATDGFHQHEFSKWETVLAPDCVTEGKEERVCECGETEVQIIAATGEHEYYDVVTTIPTCVEDGVRTFTCEMCGDSYTETEKAAGEYHLLLCVRMRFS